MAKKYLLFKKELSKIKDLKETIKALEKISAANIHFLKITSQRMEDYEKELKNILSSLKTKALSHPLFKEKKVKEKLKVLLMPQKGLCGSILNQLADFFEKDLEKNDKILVVGEQGKKLLKERKIKIDFFFSGFEEIPKESEVRKIKKFILFQFLKKKVSEVIIYYPKFETFVIQRPAKFIFLPIGREKFEKEIEESFDLADPIFEPNLKKVLDYLLKEYLGVVVYQKILETKLSELSARTFTLEKAGQKTDDLIKNLSYQYLQEKREAVTKSLNDLFSHRMIKRDEKRNF